MISLPGYDILSEQSSENGFVQFSGRHIRTSRPVIATFYPVGTVLPTDIDALCAAYQSLTTIDSKHAVPVFAVEKIIHGADTGLVIVMEPVDGRVLSDFVSHDELPVDRFLDIAIQLATAVNDLHKCGIIHRGLTGGGTVIVPETGLVRVANVAPPILFARTSSLIDDRDLRVSGIPAQHLPYMSPEQTGRMNRRVDYRTDLYSRGVIYYELLTGHPPFTAGGAKEIIHGHMAHRPVPPVEKRPEIPQPVSDIVMKLLAKTPEDRYQSAYGLRADLKICRERFTIFGHIDHPFIPGRQDVAEILTLSERLFGRDAELARLISEYDGVRRGDVSIVLITGYAGIGKTRLARELEKYQTGTGGYFISGRYEQLQQNIPYAGVIDAFKEMIQQILTEDADRVETWRQRLTEALGTNAQIIIDAIPELEFIIGPQPAIADLPATDIRNRFNMTFEKFFRIFAAEDHPLTIFIDNMQWIDLASLQQMEAFFTGTRARHILLIGACRNNEISDDHPVHQTLAAIREKGRRVSTLLLEAITVSDVYHFLEDTLKRTVPDLSALSEIIWQKTHGNPFFIQQFIESLHSAGLLYYDFETGCWQWDIEKIKSQGFTHNVVDLMAEKVLRLPGNTQDILRLASCIGNRFDLDLLVRISPKDPIDVALDLWPAVEEGVVSAFGSTYSQFRELLIRHLPPTRIDPGVPLADMKNISLEFQHDKLRQAIYFQVPAHQRKNIHVRIGRLLLKQADPALLQNSLFEIVNHLNSGADIIVNEKDRDQLAGLNLMAGRKAAASRAYAPALDYFMTGERLLPETAWTDHHALRFALAREQMECEFLNMNFPRAEALFEVLMRQAQTDEDRADIYNLKMIMMAGLAKHEAAMQNGLKGLRLLGVKLPDTAGQVTVLKSLLSTKARLFRKDIDSLLNLPLIDDRRLLLIMNLLINLCFSAFLCSPYFAIVASLKVIDYTLKYGNSKASPFGYAVYGATICAIFKKYEAGERFGQLALTANERFGSPALIPNLMLIYGMGTSVWNHHLTDGLECHRLGIRTALEAGDINYAGYHIQSALIFLIASGAPLDMVAGEYERYVKFIENTRDIGALNYLISVRQFVKCLRGETHAPNRMDDDDFDEARHIEQMTQDGIPVILLRHYLLNLRLQYIMGDIDGALRMGAACRKLLHYHIGTLIEPEFYFFYALTLAAACPQETKLKRIRFRRQIKGYCGKLEKLAAHCPENFAHKHLLAAAEYARISGHDIEAMPLYQKAATSAKENGFLQNQAIAYELAAKYFLEKQYEEVARPCLTAARDAYRKWGADAKVKLLETKYPVIPGGKLPDKSLAAFDSLDFSAIVDALQTISTEIVLADLLKNLMKIVLENAGATKTQFLTVKGERLYLEAQHTVYIPEALVFKSVAADSRVDLFMPVLNFVFRTKKLVVSDDAAAQGDFISHPYVRKYQPRSVLCLPVIRQTRLVALLYLENTTAPAVFTPARIEVLQLLASQAAISLENARLYENVIHNEKELREITRHREEESLKYQARLRTLSSELSLTEERERRRIARELHDRIGHALTNASMKLRQLINRAPGDDETLKILNDTHGFIDQSIEDTHTLTFELSPPILYDLGLEAAIDWLAEQTQLQHGLAVDCIDDLTAKPIDESLRVLLFQAIRELLFNIVKHARATKVTITISKEDDNIRIAIEDDGVGFDATKSKPEGARKGGFGLFSIRERLANQGGRLEIKSSPGEGSRVTLISPMKGIDKNE